MQPDRIRSLAISLSTTLALASLARAGDWYVDAVRGSDANTGTTPDDAWRTITHAMAAAPDAPLGGTQVIHVAPGRHDAALGELFPIGLRSDFQLIGAGQELTILDGGGAGTLVQAFWRVHLSIGEQTGPLTLVEGLTLHNAAVGASLDTTGPDSYLTLRDVRITQASLAGYRSSTGAYMAIHGRAASVLESVEIDASGSGIEIACPATAASSTVPSSVELRDCRIHDNLGDGLSASVVNHTGGVSIELVRTRVSSNAGHGLSVSVDGGAYASRASVSVRDSLVDRNGGAGVRAWAYGPGLVPGTQLDLAIERSTLADNAAEGLALLDTTAPFFSTVVFVTLAGTISYGNSDDLLDDPLRPMITAAAYCDVGDGDFAGTNGNFSADPLFVDVPAGDYRLRFGSPCVESGDPLAPGERDLLGNARPLDGDLDLLALPDVGAYELAPLALTGAAHLGGVLALELWGPRGATTLVRVARGALAPTPTATPFGELWLPSGQSWLYATVRAQPGPPRVVLFPLPGDASWLGRSLGFQALMRSGGAPAGAAYTNALERTLEP